MNSMAGLNRIPGNSRVRPSRARSIVRIDTSAVTSGTNAMIDPNTQARMTSAAREPTRTSVSTLLPPELLPELSCSTPVIEVVVPGADARAVAARRFITVASTASAPDCAGKTMTTVARPPSRTRSLLGEVA